jgi:hypothetical protein
VDELPRHARRLGRKLDALTIDAVSRAGDELRDCGQRAGTRGGDRRRLVAQLRQRLVDAAGDLRRDLLDARRQRRGRGADGVGSLTITT